MEKPLETDEQEGPKVIAIKLPFDLQERILSFPFLHAISEKYPKAELHFITPRKEIEVLNLLPFKAYYHEFDENEIENIFDVHRYCANARIYNVDLFISLTNSFADACLGIGLRAKQRVGFSDKWKSLVLTHKTLRPVGHHLVEDYATLFKEIDGTSFDSRIRVISRPLTPIIPDLDTEPYLALNLAPLRNVVIEKEWIDLISMFEGQRIVLFCSDDPVKAQMLMDPFMASLPTKNTYVNFVYKNWIELGRMLAGARGVITYAGAAGALSAYVGTNALLLYDVEDPQKTGPFHFLADVTVMGTNNPIVINTPKQVGSMKPRSIFDMNEVFKKAMEFFRLQ